MADIEIGVAGDPRAALVRLRVAVRSSAQAAARLGLPQRVGELSAGPVERLWLGPDQWLLVSFAHAAAHVIEQCERSLEGLRFHAVDASAALVRIIVRGPTARTLLAMGCGLDCSVEGLPAGSCVRTRFARIAVVLVARQAETFELLVDRSHSDYLLRWLARAATDPMLSTRRADLR